MAVAGLFLPALIAMLIREKRKKREKTLPFWLMEYAFTTAVVNVVILIFITFILKMDIVMKEAINSFPFFIKYTGMAMLVSIALPYMEEIFGYAFLKKTKEER